MKYVSLVLIQELSLTGKSYLRSFPFSSNYFSLSLFILTLFSFFFPLISLLSLLFLSSIRLSLPLCLHFRCHPLSFSYFCLFSLTSSHFSLHLYPLSLFSSLSPRLSFCPTIFFLLCLLQIFFSSIFPLFSLLFSFLFFPLSLRLSLLLSLFSIIRLLFFFLFTILSVLFHFFSLLNIFAFFSLFSLCVSLFSPFTPFLLSLCLSYLLYLSFCLLSGSSPFCLAFLFLSFSFLFPIFLFSLSFFSLHNFLLSFHLALSEFFLALHEVHRHGSWTEFMNRVH